MKYHSFETLFPKSILFLFSFFLYFFFFFFISSFDDKSLPSQEISREIGESTRSEKISLIGVYLFSSKLRAPRDALRTSRPN